MSRLPIRVALACLLTVAAGQAAADTLLIDRVKSTGEAGMPARGLTTAQVQQQFGAPTQKLEPRGGQRPQWPTIHRWVYPAFTVYFERDRVIDAVANRASASETGPKPAIR